MMQWFIDDVKGPFEREVIGGKILLYFGDDSHLVSAPTLSFATKQEAIDHLIAYHKSEISKLLN